MAPKFNAARDGAFAKLSGTYLTLMARTTCRACFVAGLRDGSQYVVTLEELKAFADKYKVGMAYHPVGKRLLVARCKSHYAEKHPEVRLPV